MQLFLILSELFTSIDELVLCLTFAILPVLWFVVCCPLHSEKIFRTFSILLILLTFVLFSCTFTLKDGLLFSVLLFAECFLFDRLIPPIKKKIQEPKKIVCFEDKPLVTQTPPPEIASHSLDETNLCLDHAFEVTQNLKRMALSGGDRLETDNVELTLRMYRAKGILTDREMRSLNDCLALLLKLKAKYEC